MRARNTQEYDFDLVHLAHSDEFLRISDVAGYGSAYESDAKAKIKRQKWGFEFKSLRFRDFFLPPMPPSDNPGTLR